MMTSRLKLVILAIMMINILDVTSAAPLISDAALADEHHLILGMKKQDGESHIVRRQTTSTSGSTDTTTVIIVSVVVVGGYFLILAAIIGTLIFCFVRFDCEKGPCSLRCTRKARVGCPKLLEDNVSACCATTAKYCCPCCSNPDNWDSGELAFWIEIVILGIVCFPFALCFVILWAIATK